MNRWQRRAVAVMMMQCCNCPLQGRGQLQHCSASSKRSRRAPGRRQIQPGLGAGVSRACVVRHDAVVVWGGWFELGKSRNCAASTMDGGRAATAVLQCNWDYLVRRWAGGNKKRPNDGSFLPRPPPLFVYHTVRQPSSFLKQLHHHIATLIAS